MGVLDRLGARRIAETLKEAVVPMTLFLASVYVVRQLLANPTSGRPWTGLEVACTLGGVLACTGWYAGRQAHLLGMRNPWRVLQFSWLIGGLTLGVLMYSAQGTYGDRCREVGGKVTLTEVYQGDSRRVCVLGGVADNPYLPGTFYRAPWEGKPGPGLGLWLVAILSSSSLGLRTWRLAPTRLAAFVSEELRLAPAAGPGAVAGGVGPDGAIQACGNATLWGEVCAQAYPIERVFEPGEWCIRCAQAYNRATRELEFTVVSLFTSDIEVLNGLERMDSVVWGQGKPMPPDARLSGTERWVELGRIRVPDVLTIATVLAHVHASLEVWSTAGDERVKGAARLAAQRASKVSAWVWFDGRGRGLTYARPGERASLVLGSSRLRDLALDVGEDLVLQLDVGLLPLELRTGFRQTFLDPGREPIVQNTKQDLWIPTMSAGREREGVWVPRVEGAALRAWLELDRLRPEKVLGVASPLPYVLPGEPAESKLTEVDLVRMPLRDDQPTLERRTGDSISEWVWLPWRQVEALRKEALVMVRP